MSCKDKSCRSCLKRIWIKSIQIGSNEGIPWNPIWQPASAWILQRAAIAGRGDLITKHPTSCCIMLPCCIYKFGTNGKRWQITASSLSLPASSLPKITQRLPLPACRSLYKNHQRIAAIAYLQTAPCPAHATVSAKSPILHSPGTRQCYESPGKSQTYQEFCVPKTPCTRMHKVL